MLFTEKTRYNMEPAQPNEPMFTYLDNSARSVVKLVREKMDDFFSRYPNNHKSDLMAGIQSRNDVQHASAVYELILHEMLLNMECQVEIHPILDGLTKPDFLVTENNGSTWYLEAKLITEQSKSEHGAEKRLDDLITSLNKLKTSKYWLEVHHRNKPSTSLSGKKMRGELLDWLASLDYPKLRSQFQDNGFEAMPQKRFIFDDFTFTVSAIPKVIEDSSGASNRPIGIDMSSLEASQTAKAICSAVKKKATHYEGIDKPFFIAINDIRSYVDPSDVLEALFGVQAYYPNFDLEGSLPFSVQEDQDGALIQKGLAINTKVTGCIIASSVTIWNFANTTFNLYMNPNAKLNHTTILSTFPTVELNLNDNYATKHPGIQLMEVFRLPAKWPMNISTKHGSYR